MSIDPILNRLAVLIAESDGLESLVRPLLELLEIVTGLDSTYVTSIDFEQSVQKILFARNTRELVIPEDLVVPWQDTLCKRALDEKQAYTDDVAGLWGDSEAARQLGITTYLSEPIRLGEGEVFGTLCGASSSKVEVSAESRKILSMFATLIARQLERELLLAKLQQENRLYSEYALSDPLTGIPNRRALVEALCKALANAERTGSAVHLAFIDLDGFKGINDLYGHDAGDRFLIQMAKTLAAGLREGDFVARYGGDEFVVFGPVSAQDHSASRDVLHQRLEALSRGSFDIGISVLDYPGASVGVVTSRPGERDCETLLARADKAMYQAKTARRQKRPRHDQD